jgi:hypothetical protein
VPSPRLGVREVRCTSEHIQTISALRVTLPLRTAVDLARWHTDSPTDDQTELVPLIAALLEFAGHTGVEPARRLCAGPNVPYKALALERLNRAQVLLDENRRRAGAAASRRCC